MPQSESFDAQCTYMHRMSISEIAILNESVEHCKGVERGLTRSGPYLFTILLYSQYARSAAGQSFYNINVKLLAYVIAFEKSEPNGRIKEGRRRRRASTGG